MEQGVNRVCHPIILASPGDWSRCCALGRGGERISPHLRQDRNPSHVLACGLLEQHMSTDSRLDFTLSQFLELSSLPR